MSKSQRRLHRERQAAALDLVEAYARGEDADFLNIADALVASDANGTCYTLATFIDAALQLWADDANIDKAEALTRLRAKITANQEAL